MRLNNYLLVDLHGLAYWSQQNAKIISGDREVQSIHHTVRSIRRHIQECNAIPIVLWDGKPIVRQEYYSKYKNSDKEPSDQVVEMKKQFQQQKEDLRQILKNLGVMQLIANDGEADDLAAMCIERIAKKANHIYLLTGDGDWLQLVDDKVSYINIREQDRIVDFKGFQQKTACQTTQQFLERKALMGDRGDNISGVGGLGETAATQLLTEFGSVNNFVGLVEKGEVTVDDLKYRSRKKMMALAQNEYNDAEKMGMLDIFNRNMMLMDLRCESLRPKSKTKVDPQFDPQAALKLFQQINLSVAINDLDIFVSPFKTHSI